MREMRKEKMFEMLSLTLIESIILFENKYYSQFAMDSSLGPTLANIYFCYYESNWLKISNQFIIKGT